MYDESWIEEGLLKRRSNYSPVLVFETTDPKRIFQLKSHVLAHQDRLQYRQRFLFDPWQGLGKLEGTSERPQFELYEKFNNGNSGLGRRIRGQDRQKGVELVQFKAALKEVDSYLKEEKTLLLLQNVSENREWDTGLRSALRSWTVDHRIMSTGSTVILQTADADELLDGFTKELIVLIKVDPSSEVERREAIEDAAEEFQIELPKERVSELVMATAGLNLHHLESTLLESYFVAGDFDVSVIKRLKSELVKQTGVLEVRDPLHNFGDIGGYQVIKDFVKKYVIEVLSQADRARRFALPLPKGLLFFGPPGTGKSLFANALASEINLPFIHLITENIYSKWFGESGQRMRNAIQMVEKMSPAVVFIDEIDRFGQRSPGFGDSAGQETRRVFAQLLEWLGQPDRKAIVVGTTNVPEHLDEAFTRTGRFDYKIPFLYPGKQARFEVLKVLLGIAQASGYELAPLAFDKEQLPVLLKEEIVPRTQLFSGAELEELITRAKRMAFERGGDRLGKQDFIEAVETFRIDLDRRRQVTEHFLEQAKQFTDDRRFLDELVGDFD